MKDHSGLMMSSNYEGRWAMMNQDFGRKEISQYHKRDPLSFAQGAFKGLTSMLPKGVNVVRQGGTFAVSSKFPWLVFGRSIGQIEFDCSYMTKQSWLSKIYNDARSKFDSSPDQTTLYLPAPSAAGVTDINASAGVGGGVHEAGHVICDNANGKFPSYETFYQKLGRHLEMTVPYTKCNLPKWVNVCADMRLEPGMALEYPEVEHRFHAIQTWCHNLEAEVRGRRVPSDFMMALRDSGKNWVSDESKQVYSEYDKKARDMVDHLKPIWQELRPRNKDWASSAHLPVYVAVEVVNALHKILEEPPEKGQGKGQGQGQGNCQGQSNDQSNDPGDKSEKSGEDTTAGKEAMSLDDIKRLLEGEGEALDPSSAMRKAVQKNKQQLDHDLYIPSGQKPIYRKLL